MARNPWGQRDVSQVTEQTMDESCGNRDDFYVFSARSREAQNTTEMLIEGKPINVIIDSGANCNLMSEGVFEFVKGVMRACWSAIREFMPMDLMNHSSSEESVILM